jgi:hypothetical protein
MSGEILGGRFVNQEFRRFAKARIGGHMEWILASLGHGGSSMTSEQLLDSLEAAWERLKRTFNPYDRMAPEVEYLYLPGLPLPEREDLGLERGSFKLTRSVLPYLGICLANDFIRQNFIDIFHLQITGIINLIDEQIRDFHSLEKSSTGEQRKLQVIASKQSGNSNNDNSSSQSYW